MFHPFRLAGETAAKNGTGTDGVGVGVGVCVGGERGTSDGKRQRNHADT